jgi:hypothetical protein
MMDAAADVFATLLGPALAVVATPGWQKHW